MQPALSIEFILKKGGGLVHKCCAASSAACERTFARKFLSAPAAMRVSIVQKRGGLVLNAVLRAARRASVPSPEQFYLRLQLC